MIITKKIIDEFYAEKRIAVIGASRKPMKYGGRLVKDLKSRGYEVIPVNPNASEIQGLKCYARVNEISPAPKAAIVIVPPAGQDAVVADAISAGVKMLWLHEHVMKGVSNPGALARAENAGITVITGFCPFMFMPNTAPLHRIHGAILKLFKAYPK